MHSSGSVIYTILERIRAFTDDTDVDAKYTDDYLTRHVIGPSITEIWSRVNQTCDNRIVLRMSIAITANTEYYVLPPIIQEVSRICKLNDGGSILWDWIPQTEMHPIGPGWAIESNTLVLRPFPVVDETLTFWFTPSFSVPVHYATDGACNSTTSATTFTLSSAPALGMLDKRENCYTGMILRFLGSGSVWQERVIVSYDTATRVATLRNPITNAGALTGLTYEIAPPMHYGMIEAVAASGAMTVGIMRKSSESQNQKLTVKLQQAIKTIRDNYSNLQLRTGKGFARNTIDNPNYDEPLSISYLNWR